MPEMAVDSRCPHCGLVLPTGAKFCGSCGASLPDGATAGPGVSPVSHAPSHLASATASTKPGDRPAHDDQGGPLKQTMIQFAAPVLAPPAGAASPAPIDPHKTMLGFVMPADGIPASRRPASPPLMSDTIRDERGSGQGGPGASFAPAASPESLRRNVPNATMLGVAMPGIAPTGTAGQAAPPPRQDRMGQTLLGGPALPAPVPMPVHAPPPPASSSSRLGRKRRPKADPLAAAAAAVRIVPRPPPLVEEPLPVPPMLRGKRGIPVALVAGGIALLTVIAGVLLLTLSHGTPALTGEPRTGADGAELLHVSCPSCEAGSMVALVSSAVHASGAPVSSSAASAMPTSARVALTKGEADLPLTSALHIGTNTFNLALTRPGVAREETVTLDVPVTYRITPDLSRLSARPPLLALRVEAVVGSDVTVDGAQIPLDGAGHGAAPVNIAADVEGTSDEMTLIQRKLPYAIKLPGGASETGSLALRVGVAQLHLEAPGRTPVTSAPQVTVAGVVAKTAEVYLGDTQLAVGTDGRFAQTVPVVVGMTPLVLFVEQGATVATRTMHINVQRVTDLQAEANARDATNPLGYDAIAGEIDKYAGQSVAIEGPIVEARQVGRGTILLVDDHRSCARSPCLTRVLHGDINDPAQGSVVRVYGKVTRSFRTASGSVVPEVEADFVVPGPSSGSRAGAHKTSSPPDVRN
jgi:hypothetical protein